MKKTLTIALTKGRILTETLPLLAACDIFPEEDIDKSRKLSFATNHAHIQLLVLRGSDVLTYVQHGIADLGVAGKDMIMELGDSGLYELLDLNIARCRLMTAGPVDMEPVKGRIKVATKFVHTARRFFAEKGMQADVIKLYGGMELAPIVGLSDLIVDVVYTGNTLRANGLEPLEHISDISSRLVANKASMRIHYKEIQMLIAQMTPAIKR